MGLDPTQNGGNGQFGLLALVKLILTNPMTWPAVAFLYVGWQNHQLVSALLVRLDQQTALLNEILRALQ